MRGLVIREWRRILLPGVESLRLAIPGIAVAVALAVLAGFVSEEMSQGIGGAPQFPPSPVLWAVLIGMLWRNTLGVPAWCTEGLNWAMHGMLRTGIALVGLRLTLSGVTAIATTALPIALTCLAVALIAGAIIARVFSVPKRLATLLAIGTAVCGCTAVVAMSPVLRARHFETAFAVTCVVLFGCIAMLCYPWVAGYFFANSAVHAGIFLGTSIHDTSQVIGSALIYSQQSGQPDALTAASVAKLLRNLSIVVLIPLAAWYMRKQEAEDAERDGVTIEPVKQSRFAAVPFFVVAFIGFVAFRTVGDSAFAGMTSWTAFVAAGQSVSQLLLTCGMTAVGLSVSFVQLRNVGWRPLAAGFAMATTVGVCSLLLTLLSQSLLSQ